MAATSSSFGHHHHDSDDPELELFGRRSAGSANDPARVFNTAPIITGDAFLASPSDVFPQRAVYGQIIAQQCPGFPTNVDSEKVYINTNAPFSAVVCGVQGSGKSHSTSVLLESCLIVDKRIGTLPKPLSAIVFHYDTAAGSGAVQPCEAAYVGALDPKRGGNATPPQVTVLVLPSTLNTMRTVYRKLGSHIRVEPLRLAPEDISGERLLSMMKVDSDTQMPLYMESIMDILRSMEDSFDYKRFRDELQIRMKNFNPSQKSMLNLRLTLLDSCLEGGTKSNRAASFFHPGQLTIIDLSSAFMDGSTACGLFEIILGLFIEADRDKTGKLVVLDEAHKYLTSNASSSRLTDSLLSIIRQQRHLGTRVLISTQEPTVVPPQFLDLCSFVIAHRFSSPMWLKHLEQHVSTVDSDWLAKVISLRTGEALIFAPSGVGLALPDTASAASTNSDDDEDEICAEFPVKGKQRRKLSISGAEVRPLGQGYLHVQSRLRVTLDGGMSIMSTDETLRQGINADVSASAPAPSSSARANVATLSSVSQFAGASKLGMSGLPTPTTPPRPTSSFPSSNPYLAHLKPMAPIPIVNLNTSAATSQPVPISNAPVVYDSDTIDDLRRTALGLYREGKNSFKIHKLVKLRKKSGKWDYTGDMFGLVDYACAINLLRRNLETKDLELMIEQRFKPLVDVLSEQYQQQSLSTLLGSQLGPLLQKRRPGCYVAGKLKDYVDAAVAAGLVRSFGTSGNWSVGLAVM